MCSETREQVAIREHVGAYLGSTGSSKRDLAKRLGIPYSTFISKLNGPSEFSYSEGVQLAKELGISPSEMAEPLIARDSR